MDAIILKKRREHYGNNNITVVLLNINFYMCRWCLKRGGENFTSSYLTSYICLSFILNGIKLYENTFLIRLQFSMLLGPIGSLKVNHFDTLGPFTSFQ